MKKHVDTPWFIALLVGVAVFLFIFLTTRDFNRAIPMAIGAFIVYFLVYPLLRKLKENPND
ncbi:hypothetical protein [Evansella clarkii]|uniref:hypothetical protein n=1 Tax=Evansella clarkii TaxID=79879 RepID=UPI0009968E4A|nr:hypothetical protein [Evansella clarkii]